MGRIFLQGRSSLVVASNSLFASRILKGVRRRLELLEETHIPEKGSVLIRIVTARWHQSIRVTDLPVGASVMVMSKLGEKTVELCRQCRQHRQASGKQ
jgi:hypothetical protein